MTEPLRFDPAASAADVPERDRDARIEELLLAGLDHYFNGQLEQAINVWTRVLFLDRGHARARAYIERARGAVSERQREGEELIHAGAAAFERGDAESARRLITSALERGAATEEAFALLERLDRVEAAGVQQESRPWRRNTTVAGTQGGQRDAAIGGRGRLIWVAAGVIFGLVGGASALLLLDGRNASWLPLGPAAEPPAVTSGLKDPLPVPGPGEIRLVRARRLYERGRLREALNMLDEVGHGDPVRASADELRGIIQGRLLETARGNASSGARQ
jgi:tetratricopeptide (TPR) repeat protein